MQHLAGRGDNVACTYIEEKHVEHYVAACSGACVCMCTLRHPFIAIYLHETKKIQIILLNMQNIVVQQQ